MPQMAPYNWLVLNFLFTIMFLLTIILLNFIPMNKYLLFKKKMYSNYMIKW